MQVRVLGTLEIVADDRAPVPLASPKLRRLLAALVVDATRVVSADRLADVVWGDDQPEHSTGALHNLVSRLRRLLRSAAASEDHAVTLLTRAPGYLLALDDEQLDARLFERLTQDARTVLDDDPARAAAVLDRALGLWRGDAYAEFGDETFARFEAARLEELRTSAHEARVETALAQGHTDDAIARLEPLIGRHALRQRPHAQLMVALHLAGRQAEALAVYRRYRARLGDELGLEPSTELQDLERRVLRGDPTLAPRRSVAVTTRRQPSPPATAEEVPQPSPVEAAAGGRPGNLPVPVELIGRASLVAQVAEAVSDASVVTLAGPGGVGKTSVALAVATRIASGYRDGVWWCELASLDPGGAVTEMVMTVLDAQLRPGTAPVSGVVDYLRHQQALLVLDNAEQVVDEVAALVAALVRDCPGVRVLLTSRERIGAPSERVIAVPPLAVPPPGAITDAVQAAAVPAIALFARRAAAVAAFALTDANHETVAEICRRLDGVPLALELAATRMRSMGPDDLVDRLTWRFRVLRGARRGGAERHRTLRAVVDWSYDLLDTRAQRVFERLSVFAGDFTLAGAEQVVVMAGDDVELPDVADVIAELVDASMVTAAIGDGAARYSLLETIRAYGRERLAASGHEPAARRAHARYFVELAESTAEGLYDTDNPQRVAVLDRAIDELRAAHAWACANDLDLALRLVSALPIYAEQRAHGEAFSWAERTIERAEQSASGSVWLADAYGAAALSARFRGDIAQATTYADRALGAATVPRDPGGAIALYTLAEVALYEGRLDDVRRLTARLHRLPLRPGHRALATWAGASVLLVQAYQGAGEIAVAAAERMLAAARRNDDHAAIAWAFFCLAEALADIDPPRAVTVAEQALTRSRALGERFLTGVALVTVASLHARHGDATIAVRLFRETVDRWHRAGNWTQQWIAARSIVGLLVRLGADEPAATLHGALSTRTTATAPWGADANRLAAADATLSERLPPDRRAAARHRGAEMRDDEVIAWIRAVLADLGDR